MLNHHNLYRNVNIPLPSQPLTIHPNDTEESVCSKLDSYFDDIIRNYPQSTRALLQRMYYDGENVVPVERSLEKGSKASWELSMNDGVINYKMVIDSRLTNCPVMFRWNKIHEIAGHIGQVHQRIEQIGLSDWIEEINNGAFRKFTEQSIAFAEKVLLDALPKEVIRRDLEHIPDQSIRNIKEYDIMFRKNLRMDDYIRLKHRMVGAAPCPISAAVTEEDHALILNRSDVSDFLETRRHETQCINRTDKTSIGGDGGNAKNLEGTKGWFARIANHNAGGSLYIGGKRTDPKSRDGASWLQSTGKPS